MTADVMGNIFGAEVRAKRLMRYWGIGGASVPVRGSVAGRK
jgi:hypothetical protein